MWRQPFIVAMPKDHPLAAEKRVRVSSLAGEPLIASSVELELGFGGQINEIATEGKFTPKIVGRAPDILTILTLVAAGFGVGFVPESFRAVAIPGVVYRPLAGPSTNALLAAARRRNDAAPAVRAFMRVVRATLATRLAAGSLNRQLLCARNDVRSRTALSDYQRECAAVSRRPAPSRPAG